MSKYRYKRTRRQRLRIFYLVLIIIIAILAAATLEIRHVYDQNLQPISNNQKEQIVVVKNGASVTQIANLLKSSGLVRNTWAFEWYIQSKELRADLEAGTYALSPSQTVPDIVTDLTEGKVQTNLVTILPGKRLDQVQAELINSGFNPTSVSAALQPSQYSDLPALADKPAGASLEGLLYPDSFQKTADTSPTVIIRESLTEMGQHLTPAIQAAFAQEGLTTYQGITLASIVQQEVSSQSDQSQAAQVFLKRLSQIPPMPLGSDVTAFYGAILAGQSPSLSYDSPYNTLIHSGLPPTPIGTVSQQSLNAVAHPANTDWLYFVTGDNGTTYFEQTAAQHQADVTQYCHKLCTEDSQ